MTVKALELFERGPQLDDEVPVPLYYQLEEIVQAKIKAGRLTAGDLLPSEKELSQIYGVSRATVRQALESLVRKGLLLRQRGRGTFVAKPKVEEGLPRLASFSEEMQAKGWEHRTKVLRVEEIEPPQAISDKLGAPAGGRVLLIQRLRSVDSEPVVLSTSYLPVQLGIDPTEDFSKSIYQLLEQKYGIRIESGKTTIEGSVARGREAKLLGIPSGAPTLRIRRLALDDRHQPIEYVEATFRADRYRYSVELKRKADQFA